MAVGVDKKKLKPFVVLAWEPLKKFPMEDEELNEGGTILKRNVGFYSSSTEVSCSWDFIQKGAQSLGAVPSRFHVIFSLPHHPSYSYLSFSGFPRAPRRVFLHNSSIMTQIGSNPDPAERRHLMEAPLTSETTVRSGEGDVKVRGRVGRRE
ncbi:hypothetical protein HPP92_012936 [Vanilla planifolia]|uniref:Uncharacterized protein n=1 Tax=Vanilla planifolia TaxID=51239 RepID=A0A835UXI4_VANPL|nr:hypothetical protein HPP92_012936 [Vanilla planifolia]